MPTMRVPNEGEIMKFRVELEIEYPEINSPAYKSRASVIEATKWQLHADIGDALQSYDLKPNINIIRKVNR